MIGIEIYVNDKLECIAGSEKMEIMTAGLSWVNSKEELVPVGTKPLKQNNPIYLYVGGMQTNDSGVGEHLFWISSYLNVGDHIKYRITTTLQFDQPKEIKLDSPDDEIERKKSLYAVYKQEFDGSHELVDNPYFENENEITCFQIFINDVYVCRAGINPFGVLSATLCWIEETQGKDLLVDEIRFRVGGLLTKFNGREERVEWVERFLNIDDEILIKIILRGKIDPLIHREEKDPFTDEINRENRRKAYNKMKEEFE